MNLPVDSHSVPAVETEIPPAHTQSVDAVLAALSSDPRAGLSESEARARLEKLGRNELTAAKPVPVAVLLCEERA